MADPVTPGAITKKDHVEQAPAIVTASTDNRLPPESGTEQKSPSDKPNLPCGCHKMGGRNLIVCIDGTSNQFGEKNTNVIELYKLILKEDQDRQRTWYNSGIGTYVRPSWTSLDRYKQILLNVVDTAIAYNFKRTVLGAYRWLSDNYESGDCIFLFGFSRGAYQVRVLSAMIDKVGLIYKGNEMQIPFAYELYADHTSDKEQSTQSMPTPPDNSMPPTNDQMSKAEHFKSTFSRKDVKVHFVGAWDTVSSIGIARGKYMLPRTIDGMTHVCYFRHALALDELRVKFLPEYAYGGRAEPPGRSKGITDTIPHTKEVWFAGTHSDIGGGNIINLAMDRSRPPLRWMVFEAKALGLRMASFNREMLSAEAAKQLEIIESLTWLWLPLEIFPFKRLTFTRNERGPSYSHKPHLGASRKIHKGQKIHSSLLQAQASKDVNQKYFPKARPAEGGNFWEMLLRDGMAGQYVKEWVEVDMYQHTQSVVESFVNKTANKSERQRLHRLATTGDGRQAIYDKVIEVLQTTEGDIADKLKENEVKDCFLCSIVDVFKKTTTVGLSVKGTINTWSLVSDLQDSGQEKYQKTAQEFMALFGTVFRGHTRSVLAVAFSPDGKRVVSGSVDSTVRMWDAVTGEQVGEPFRGHIDWVRSVGFSPDGKRVVSSSDDSTVRMWDAATGEQVGEPFRGHTGWVWSVGFSPDGKWVVSGSDDKTVRMWDAATGEQVGEPFRGHTDSVLSVGFSPDGKRVVSGSDDKTVRMWDAATREQVGMPFRGHTHWVRSVGFSPDGKRVVSGSGDKTVRMWDAATGEQVGEPFRGHTGSVLSVGFSPDGKRVVSGSGDKTVRMWDAATGEQVGEPFRGHTDRVWSVAFSPDGKWVVSGSDDKTIRIWNSFQADHSD